MSITVREFDFDVQDPKVKTDLQIIRETLLAIKYILDDLESRVKALEAP